MNGKQRGNASLEIFLFFAAIVLFVGMFLQLEKSLASDAKLSLGNMGEKTAAKNDCLLENARVLRRQINQENKRIKIATTAGTDKTGVGNCQKIIGSGLEFG